MKKIRRVAYLCVVLVLVLVLAPDRLSAADPLSRTFNAPIDRVWAVTESVLKSLGWEIDQSDRAVGWLLTDSRGVDFKDYAVYGKGLRHKLRIALKAAGATFANVIKANYYMRDASQVGVVREIRSKYFTSELPASTLVEIPRLAQADLLIEVEVVAVV